LVVEDLLHLAVPIHRVFQEQQVLFQQSLLKVVVLVVVVVVIVTVVLVDLVVVQTMVELVDLETEIRQETLMVLHHQQETLHQIKDILAVWDQ
tara:strand:- start:1100 stop:1378 length:279 start_codon:yes stop_codon:yes gene_type:complete